MKVELIVNVEEITPTEIYMLRRQNYLDFTADQVVSVRHGLNVKDCAMNQIIYQGAQCSLCTLIAPTGAHCYREMGFVVK